MTTFTRIGKAFVVQASAGSTTEDFSVSTDGTINLVNTVNFAGGNFSSNVGVSGNVSVGGTTKMTGAVTADGAFTVSGAFTGKGAGAIGGAFDVSTNLSVGGTTKLTGAVTAEGAFTVSGAARFINGVSCEATVAMLSPNVFLSLVSSTTPANFAAGALWAVKNAAGVVFRIPACSSAW